MPSYTFNVDLPPGPCAPEHLDAVLDELEKLLPLIIEERRKRRQEMHELLVDMYLHAPTESVSSPPASA